MKKHIFREDNQLYKFMKKSIIAVLGLMLVFSSMSIIGKNTGIYSAFQLNASAEESEELPPNRRHIDHLPKSGNLGGNFRYKFDEETGKLKIFGKGDMPMGNIPEFLSEEDMFHDIPEIKSVEFEEGITSITDCLFANCENLSEAKFPSTLLDFGNNSFKNCTSLKSIEIPKNMKILSGGAFSECTNLKKVVIPKNIEEIEWSVFEDCTSLDDIVIENDNVIIDHNAFLNTGYYNNKENWDNGILYLGKYLLDSKEDIKGYHIIKEGTQVICKMAFCNRDVEGLAFPKSLKTIQKEALLNCDTLSYVYFPNLTSEFTNSLPLYDFDHKPVDRTVRLYTDTQESAELMIWGLENTLEYHFGEKIPLVLEINTKDITMNLFSTCKPEFDYITFIGAKYDVSYSSRNEKIVQVDENGNVKAVGVGKTYIICKTVDSNGNENSVNCNIEVRATRGQILICVALIVLVILIICIAVVLIVKKVKRNKNK